MHLLSPAWARSLRPSKALFALLTLGLLSGVETAASRPAIAAESHFCTKFEAAQRVSLVQSPFGFRGLEDLRDELQERQRRLKLQVNSDRIEPQELRRLAQQGASLEVDLARTSFSASELRLIRSNHGRMSLRLNSDRLSPRDLRGVAQSGVPVLLDVSATQISPRSIRDLQRVSRTVELWVNSDRIPPDELRHIARRGVHFLIDVERTSLSAKDIERLYLRSKAVTLLLGGSRLTSQEVGELVERGLKLGNREDCAF